MPSIVWSAFGTTTDPACPPPSPPKYSPWPNVPLSTHWLNQPLRQSRQCPQEVKKLETTRSPGLKRLTSLPTSPHELVTGHGAHVHRRVPVKNVEVGAADRTHRHLEQSVTRTADGRLGHVHDLDVAFALVGQRLHLLAIIVAHKGYDHLGTNGAFPGHLSDHSGPKGYFCQASSSFSSCWAFFTE